MKKVVKIYQAWGPNNKPSQHYIFVFYYYYYYYYLLTYLFTYLLTYLITYLLTHSLTSLGGSSPYTRTDKTNENKYT